ncbi:protein STICHEL-like 4 isoform X2 [Aristolochia californica]
MTRAIRGRFLKDENGAISDHLRNHVHLTNCIHLKNHMHRHSPIPAERSLMRDLVVLQRSRSLRDPSTSPRSWHSPSVIDTLARTLEKDDTVHHGRRSLGAERRTEIRRFPGNSPPLGSVATSKVAAAEIMKDNESGENFSDHSSTGRVKGPRKSKGENPSRKIRKSDISEDKTVQNSLDLSMDSDLVSQKADHQDKKILRKGIRGQSTNMKTLFEQLRVFPGDSEDGGPSQCHHHGRNVRKEQMRDEAEGNLRGSCNELNRIRKQKVRGTRKGRVSVGSRDVGPYNELSVASNSLAQGSRHPKYRKEERQDDVELEGPRNGCGLPWNWSRIHNRSKTFLDIAGRSLSCGLSESRLMKAEGSMPQNRRDSSDVPVVSDHSCSSGRSDSEALPLLFEPSGSHENMEHVIWPPRDYSGELGIFENHKLKHDRDPDLASEARSRERRNYRGSHYGRHRSLTQKYRPKTFKDLVGKNLVVQALSNAIIRRKVGLLYVFYGPHGTGKTSCARIFAKALNCLSQDHPKPCGTCTSCIAQEMGKSRNVQEVGGVGNFDFETIMDLLENMVTSQLASQYRVFIVDDCDTWPQDSWNAISKVIDLAPRKVVFVLVSTSLDHLPHIIISRCQKFFFPKLKDADIINIIQWIATKEGLEIDKDALKLIASRSDGSLRDAEMTLDQLSLLGQKISLPLVQELVGLISDEKLVDLLDLALSADTVNTVKNLREIMEAGVEPLALMSQLATIITDILAGSYVFTRERLRRKFFRRPTLSKEDMEKLRQALKTLSEAEKQLRLSNDRLTWLTAALLQLAPDKQYILPSSSGDTSLDHSPVVLSSERVVARKWNSEQAETTSSGKGLSASIGLGNLNTECADEFTRRSNFMGRKGHVGFTPPRTSTDTRGSARQISGTGRKEIEEIWQAVLDNIEVNTLKQLMQQEGKLISVSYCAASTVLLIFSSHVNKSKAEKFRGHILQAFESVLGSPVTIEIRGQSKKDLRASENGMAQTIAKPDSQTSGKTAKSVSENRVKKLLQDRTVKGVSSSEGRCFPSDSLEAARGEIVELGSSQQDVRHIDGIPRREEKGMESFWVEDEASNHCNSTLGSVVERRKVGDQTRQRSLVRSKVSLAHVIQQAEGQRSGWSKRKAVSIAEKLEQENLRLEPRSRSLLCWRASTHPRAKIPHLRIRTRRPHSLLKLVSCSKCLSVKSPRK